MVRITDKEFVYTPSYDTDLAKKFRAIIERQRSTAPQRSKVVPSGNSPFVPTHSSGTRSHGAAATL